MTDALNQQLVENISLILKKSLAADATLADLREKKQAKFIAIFKQDSIFQCSADTFQPYVQEVADDYVQWQQTHDKQLLIAMVKKIELLFKVLNEFEASYTLH
jgi:primosomal protein N''